MFAIDARGAEHWSYTPIVRPALPRIVGPAQSWSENGIDRFILSMLTTKGLTPSPRADRETLIRRLTLDLTGTPPTVEEIQAFQVDSRPDAYERLVQRLLASHRFGEQMAVAWLDAARYADTHGYHMDAHREMWRWRDGLIAALNANMPFDQFSIEQLAGDLLPNATTEQKIASGFHRNHMINFEDGSIAAEYRTEYVADRAVTTATVWLGMTLACARCHDHFYDPISQAEFFRFYAFFNHVPENGIDGDQGNAAPTILAPTAEQEQRLCDLQRRISSLEKQLRDRESSVDREFERWAAQQGGSKRRTDPPIATYRLPLDNPFGPAGAVTVTGEPVWIADGTRRVALFNGNTHFEMRQPDPSDIATLSAWVFPTTRDEATLFAKARYGPHSRGFELRLNEGRLELRAFDQPRKRELRVITIDPLPTSQWRQVTVTIDRTGGLGGVKFYVDGVPQSTRTLTSTLPSIVSTTAPLTIAGPEAGFRGMLDDIRIFDRALTPTEVAALAGVDPVAEILSTPPASRTDSQNSWLRGYYLDNIDRVYSQLANSLAELRQEKRSLESAVSSVMVMADSAPRKTFVLRNGRYDAPTSEVVAGVPSALPAMHEDLPRNRLGLAHWIVSPDNPLTARVVVNRIWQHHFGHGLVRTADDFGTQGTPPTHPQLLDWLAAEFVSSGWDVKHLHRLIVTSATYRQSSHTTADRQSLDSENRWLSRMPRVRLAAETIRDSALFASGLLVQRVGGPGVFPYQPAGLWRELAYDPDEFTAQTFVQSKGADLYRRSIYTFYKRSVPPPNIEVFDAPSREQCFVSRPTTNTPAQALTLMNDVTFVEAAAELAERVMRRSGPLQSKVSFVVQRVLGRTPDDTEVSILIGLWQDQRDLYGDAPDRAAELVTNGNRLPPPDLPHAGLAAWTALVSVLFQTDEFVVRP